MPALGCLFLSFLLGTGGLAKAPPNATEVVVIATEHFITDMPEGYNPADLRALLKKVAPQAIAAEAPGNVRSPWQAAPFELWNVTKPWADSTGTPILPAGWDEPTYAAQVEQMMHSFQEKGKWREYQAVELKFQAQGANHVNTCAWMNSEGYHGLWRQYHAGLHILYGKETPWESWNAHILESVAALCEKFRGKRVAVVFGGAHAYYLIDHLSSKKGIRVVPTAAFLPTAEEVAAQIQPFDFLKALRMLNFAPGSLTVKQLADLEEKLKRLDRFSEYRNDRLLFAGKLFLHKNNPKDALVKFEALVPLDAGVLSAFDSTTRLKEAGVIYAALAKNSLGRPAEARTDLQGLIKDASASAAMKNWAEQILAGIPGS